MNVSEGQTIRFEPKNGGRFPTGESTRTGVVEAVRGDEIVVRKPDDFTERVSKEQIVS